MDVYLIWAIVPDEPNSPWVVAAWDSESVAGNPDGWDEELAKAEQAHGGRYIRVTVTHVDYDAVINAFEAARV